VASRVTVLPTCAGALSILAPSHTRGDAALTALLALPPLSASMSAARRCLQMHTTCHFALESTSVSNMLVQIVFCLAITHDNKSHSSMHVMQSMMTVRGYILPDPAQCMPCNQ
jgi:hypothetical protein